MAARLVGLREGVRGRIRALVVLRLLRLVLLLMMLLLLLVRMLLLRRVSLRVGQLVDDARRSRMVKVLRRRRTLLLVVGMMLHRDKMHQ